MLVALFDRKMFFLTVSSFRTLMTETFYLDIREIGIFLADSAENGKEDVAK